MLETNVVFKLLGMYRVGVVVLGLR